MTQPAIPENPKANTAPNSGTARPRTTEALQIVGLLIALVVAGSAFVYYRSGQNTGTASVVPAPVKSEDAASASVETTQPSAGDAITTPAMPETAATEAAGQPGANGTAKESIAVTKNDASLAAKVAPRVHAKPARRHLAKASKAARPVEFEPRERLAALAVTPHPIYPPQALRAGEQGTVLVLAQVDVTGKVTNAHVVGGSGFRILDQAATDEVRHWKFSPALRNGHPVVASVEVPVNYRLN